MSTFRFFQASILDPVRRRQLNVIVFAPVRHKVSPIPIVFSHGNGVPAEAYFYLGRHWAAAGYLTLFPIHRGRSEVLSRSENWGDRPRDVTLVLDHLEEIGRLASLRGLSPETNAGVAGHSHGAHTALALMGARVQVRGSGLSSFSDARISCAIALSPPGTGDLGLRTASWRYVRGPLLTIAGSRDGEPRKRQPPRWRTHAFRRSTQAERHHISIPGADHMAFVDAFVLGEDSTLSFSEAETLAGLQHATLSFWNRFLGDRSEELASPWRIIASGGARSSP